MKKIIILLTPILIFTVVFGCSKDHEAPTFGTYKTISTPENVEATYDSGKDVASGVYFYRIKVEDSALGGVGDFIVTKKLVLLK